MQRYVPMLMADEDELTRNIVYLASEYGRYGYRFWPMLLKKSSVATQDNE